MAADTTWPKVDGLHPEVDILGRPWYLNDLARRTLVTECLHDKGVANGRVSIQLAGFVRGLGDGFGPIAEGVEGYSEMLWDWSHVRDSSPAGFQRMFDFLVTEKVLPLRRDEKEAGIAAIVAEGNRITPEQARYVGFLCGTADTFRYLDGLAGSGSSRADVIGAWKVRQARNMRDGDRPVFFDALKAAEAVMA